MKEKKKLPAPTSYEATHELKSLVLVVTIVNFGQEAGITKLLKDNEAALVCILHGHGTAEAETYSRLALNDERKHVVVSVLRKEKWPEYKEAVSQRFSVSQYAKGIAYCIDISSVFGISIYKMLTNTQIFEKAKRKKAVGFFRGRRSKKEAQGKE